MTKIAAILFLMSGFAVADDELNENFEIKYYACRQSYNCYGQFQVRTFRAYDCSMNVHTSRLKVSRAASQACYSQCAAGGNACRPAYGECVEVKTCY